MEKSEILFWNVDTQIDFMDPDGKLYAPGAEQIKSVLKEITIFAAENHIRVVNTCDYHNSNTPELSSQPDFIITFPEHCMADTRGAQYVSETNPEDPFIVDWTADENLLEELKKQNPRNIVIRKDAFDVFIGNPYTDRILEMICPEKTFVYGVTTNVCVDQAVMGLTNRGIEVYVFRDAIKELPKIPLPFEKWNSCGVKLISFSEVDKFIH